MYKEESFVNNLQLMNESNYFITTKIVTIDRRLSVKTVL